MLDFMHRTLDHIVEAIEWFVVLALVVLSLSAAFTLVTELVHLGAGGFTLGSVKFNDLIGTLLEIFILVELFRIATAYMERRNVIPTVLEAALVAVARKFIVFESADPYVMHAAGLSMLLLAVAVSSWLLAKARTYDAEK